MSGLADEIPFLSRCLEGTDIELLELTNGRDVIRLRPGMPGHISTPLASGSEAPFDIMAPSVGVFRYTHPLRKTSLAQAGQQLMAGDPVGVLQIGELLVHVVAPKDGTVLGALVEDGAVVGYGTALIRFTGRAKQ